MNQLKVIVTVKHHPQLRGSAEYIHVSDARGTATVSFPRSGRGIIDALREELGKVRPTSTEADLLAAAISLMAGNGTETFDVEYTDTFAGEANYSWLRSAKVTVPTLQHYDRNGSSKPGHAQKMQTREVMRRAKAAMGLTGVSGRRATFGDVEEFRPFNSCTVLFVTPAR